MEEIKRENRKISVKEKKRLDNFEKISEKLKKDGYERHDLTISLKEANTKGLLFPLPFVLLFIVLYFFVFNNDFESWSYFLVILYFLVSLVIHELLHGITWAIFTKRHFKDIEFGLVLSELTPYCTCKSYLKKYQYIIGSIMPFLILGIIFTTFIFFFPNVNLFVLGLLMLFGTGGDLTIIYLILKNKSKKEKVLYIDHPVNCGVVMFDK